MALDETALRAFLQSRFGHGLVFQAREHHQRDAGRGCADPAHRVESLRSGHLAERTGVCGVVFDQQNRSDRFLGHPLRA